MDIEQQNATGEKEIAHMKETKKAEKKTKPVGNEKKSVWSVLLGLAQLAVVGAYGFFAFKCFAAFASENAIDIIETVVDDLGLQELVISENLLLFVGIVAAVLALATLASTVFLIIQKRALKRAAMYISIGAELVAVVGIALFCAFKANLFNLLYFIPHVLWYGTVVAYVAVSTADPAAAAKRKAEKEAKARAKAEEAADVDEEATEEENNGTIEQENGETVVETESKKVIAEAVVQKKAIVKKVVVEEDESEEVVVVTKKKKKPAKKAKKKTKIRRVLYWIIAIVHTAALGLVLFVGSVINAIASNSADYDIMFQNFLRDFEVRDITISKTQLMSVFILHAIVSIAFIVTGIGLLRRSKMFAEITKHFSLGVLIFMAVSLLMQGFASFTIMMGVYFAWFLFVTIFFRVANLDGFLRVPPPSDEEDDEQRDRLNDL